MTSLTETRFDPKRAAFRATDRADALAAWCAEHHSYDNTEAATIDFEHRYLGTWTTFTAFAEHTIEDLTEGITSHELDWLDWDEYLEDAFEHAYYLIDAPDAFHIFDA